MDNKTLKAFIIEQKEQYNLSYREIADKLEKEYGIVRSRQSLQGMYKRGVESKNTVEQKERFIASADIVNVYCLGYSMVEVKDIVNGFGFELTYNDVVVTIKEQSKYIQDVEKTKVSKIRETLGDCNYITDLKHILAYKEVLPTDKILKRYVAEAYRDIILDNIYDKFNEVYDFTDDRKTVKKVEELLLGHKRKDKQ